MSWSAYRKGVDNEILESARGFLDEVNGNENANVLPLKRGNPRYPLPFQPLNGTAQFATPEIHPFLPRALFRIFQGRIILHYFLLLLLLLLKFLPLNSFSIGPLFHKSFQRSFPARSSLNFHYIKEIVIQNLQFCSIQVKINHS